MNTKLAIITGLILIASASTLAYTQYNDKKPNYENQHFEIKIVSDYPTEGGLQALNKVGTDEKRTMVLRQDFEGDLKQRCNTLYKSSRTNNPNPCRMIR